MIKKNKLDTTPVRLKKDVVKRVKNYIKGTGITISGFVNYVVEDAIKNKNINPFIKDHNKEL